MNICSNVVAATDVTVLAMAGIGLHEGKVIFLFELYMELGMAGIGLAVQRLWTWKVVSCFDLYIDQF